MGTKGVFLESYPCLLVTFSLVVWANVVMCGGVWSEPPEEGQCGTAERASAHGAGSGRAPNGKAHGPSTPIHATLSIDAYPGLGEPVNVTCKVSSILDAPGTTAQIELPASARLSSGDLTWEGDLLAYTPMSFTATIEFVQKGNAAVFCRARRVIDAENSWGDLAAQYLSIGETEGQRGFRPVGIGPGRAEPGEMYEPGDGQGVDEGGAR